jgi:hypothetical protein
VFALRELGAEVIPIHTPRVSVAWRSQLGDWQQVARSASVLTPLVAALRGSEAVVNCAGIANPCAVASPALCGANALVPIILWEACRRADVARFVHVISAPVQGDREILDESEAVSPLTPYATSKAAGERLLRASNPQRVTIIRPTSVHGHDRPLTARFARFARSRFSSVAGSGDPTSPRVLVQNVGSAVARLASRADVPLRLFCSRRRARPCDRCSVCSDWAANRAMFRSIWLERSLPQPVWPSPIRGWPQRGGDSRYSGSVRDNPRVGWRRDGLPHRSALMDGSHWLPPRRSLARRTHHDDTEGASHGS